MECARRPGERGPARLARHSPHRLSRRHDSPSVQDGLGPWNEHGRRGVVRGVARGHAGRVRPGLHPRQPDHPHVSRSAQRPCGVFVTGTDTGVGKTVVTATIATALKGRGVDAGIMKPIATGSADGHALSDPDWLLSVTETRDAPDLVAPYRFRLAASPLVAAAHANVAIDLTRITQALRTLSVRHDCVLVEGIGGVLVPLTTDFFVADLIKRLDLPVLLVARSGLGSINHTLLTLDCLRSRGVPVLGLVFNHPTPPPAEPDVTETVPTI